MDERGALFHVFKCRRFLSNLIHHSVAALLTTIFALAMLGGCVTAFEKQTDTSLKETEPIYRVGYTGPQPRIANIPGVVALPYYFCDLANKWIYAYFTGHSIQFYQTDPDVSYRKYMQAVVGGSAFPWALGRYLETGTDLVYIYFINTDGLRTSEFDYTVPAASFDSCIELSALPFVEIVSCDSFLAGRGPHARCVHI